MSVEAFTWALSVPVGGNQKVVLLGLANHAHPDGTESYPALDTLATYAACDRSTARRNLRKLVEDGWVVEDGLGPRGQGKYRLLMKDSPTVGGGKVPPVASEPQGGGTGASEGVAAAPPEPTTEPSSNRTEDEAGADARDSVPDDFPDELRPHARHVMRVLVSIAETHGARKVWPMALGKLLIVNRHKPLVATAHELDQWAVDPPRPIKDVVGTYRTFLSRARDLQGVEPLADDGLPGRAVTPAGVVTLNGRRMSNAEQVDANVRALDAMRADLRRQSPDGDTIGSA